MRLIPCAGLCRYSIERGVAMLSKTGLRGVALSLMGAWIFCATGSLAEDSPDSKSQRTQDKSNAVAGAENEPKPDKSIYNLLHATPPDLMREMETDRPDATESARTLDAGHYQFEAGVFAFTLDDRNPDRVNRKGYDFWNTNYKVGLLNNVDLHVVIDSYQIVREKENGHTITKRGFGDVTLRSKINLFGNDSPEGAAFAFLPFIKIPTNQDHLGNKSVEGGLITPWTVSVPKGWTVSSQAEVDIDRDDRGSGYHAVYGGTYEFIHDIGREDLSGFVEFSGMASSEKGSRWIGTFNTGCTWALSKNIHLDAGVNIGVTPSAERVQPFLGLSMRF
jgi:hypothetical protein